MRGPVLSGVHACARGRANRPQRGGFSGCRQTPRTRWAARRERPHPSWRGLSLEALAAGLMAHARSLVEALEAPDLADLIELLEPEQRVRLIQALGADFRLRGADRGRREGARPALRGAAQRRAGAAASPSSRRDDAAYLLESLEADDQQEILEQMPQGERAALRAQPANTPRRPPAVSCRRTSSPCRRSGRWGRSSTTCARPRICRRRSRRSSSSIPAYHVLGSVDLARLLRTKRDVQVDTIMDADRHVVLATADQEEVARQFERYDLMSAPVVDAERAPRRRRHRRRRGRGDRGGGRRGRCSCWPASATSASATACARSCRRASRGCSSTCSPPFSPPPSSGCSTPPSSSMVALAVLMPIVASMGGNAGTQTMTVAVRALATQRARPVNMVRVVVRETAVGLINGLAFAVIMALVVFLLVRHRAARARHRRGDDHQYAGGGAGRHIHPAGARSHWGFDPAVASTRVRDDGDRRGRLLRLPRARHAVAGLSGTCRSMAT